MLILTSLAAVLSALRGADTTSGTITELGNGIWRIRFGSPERFTPNALRASEPRWDAIKSLPVGEAPPFDLHDVTCDLRPSRSVVRIPCDSQECPVYGFGLDPGAFNQRGLRKWLSVSAAVVGKTGASHGPVPFYLSTQGYGVYVDTARVPFVHVARLTAKDAGVWTESGTQKALAVSEKELYAPTVAPGASQVVFDIPGHDCGVDVYVFGGPTIREVVQRFNLFSGGGCLPPLWGLGQKYRTHSNAVQDEALRLAQSFRDHQIPCDMFGLEPGWQTHSYSCSLVWSEERFPNHQGMLEQLRDMGYHANLWEHAYIHPKSPLFPLLKDRAGDYLVWQGLVVDFADPEASRIFADYHKEALIDNGISAFKADECDRQPIDDTTPFNYPYCTRFPSGIDGDQMTQLYGYLYQKSILSAFRAKGLRTLGDVRATTALAAPLPFCLYSDAYTFEEYLRQLVNASFAGLLWSPEVREAATRDELLNRIGLSGLAPHMCLNMWFMPHPVWEQYQGEKNRRHELLPPEEQKELRDRIRAIVDLRMSLLPYLYAGYYRYHLEGLPPVRALVLEFPADSNVHGIDDQYMFGDALMVAPFVGDVHERSVYFPQGGDWFDYRTNKRHRGGTRETVKAEPGEVPVFVRDDTLLPVAAVVQHVAPDTVFDITVRVYGKAPRPFTLFEDDGESYAYEQGQFNRVVLAWKDERGTVERHGPYGPTRYRIKEWMTVIR